MNRILLTTCFAFLISFHIVIGQQHNLLPDSTKYRQLGIDMSDDRLHFIYTDTINSTVTNYQWPLVEINFLIGVAYNSWMFSNPESDYALNLLKFSNEFDGIQRWNELGNYEVEARFNKSFIEPYILFRSHFLPYQKSLDEDESEFVLNTDYSKVIPSNKKELRTGINIIVSKSQNDEDKLFSVVKDTDLSCEIFTDYSHNHGDTTFYQNTRFVDIAYNYSTIEKIVSQKYTAINIGFIRTNFPIVYKQEPVYVYYNWAPNYKHLKSFLLHWDMYSINGLSIGLMQRKFKRYSVELNKPMQQKYGLGKLSNDDHCFSVEYGANLFIGVPGEITNRLPYEMESFGGEFYVKTSWEPFMIKINGGRMIGRPDDWFVRVSLGYTLRAGNTVLNTEERTYVFKDYLKK